MGRDQTNIVASVVSSENREQTNTNQDEDLDQDLDGLLNVFYLRHFFINSSKSLIIDKLTCSIHFYQKTIGVCRLWNANFECHAKSHATPLSDL